MSACGIVRPNGLACQNSIEDGAQLNLCAHHLLAIYETVAGEVGVTDVLPSPCLACGSRLGVQYPSGWLCAICEWRMGEIPDAEGRPRVDVVYYLRFQNRIKIGTTGNPRQRLAQLRHDELLAFERGDRHLEQKRHAQFSEARMLRTEWFAMHDDVLQHIERLRAGVEDPWARYGLWVSQELALHA